MTACTFAQAKQMARDLAGEVPREDYIQAARHVYFGLGDEARYRLEELPDLICATCCKRRRADCVICPSVG